GLQVESVFEPVAGEHAAVADGGEQFALRGGRHTAPVGLGFEEIGSASLTGTIRGGQGRARPARDRQTKSFQPGFASPRPAIWDERRALCDAPGADLRVAKCRRLSVQKKMLLG